MVITSRHHADLLHKKDSIQASQKSYQQLQQRKHYACKKGNAKLNESLGQLKSTIGDTMELYRQTDGELDCYGDNKPVERNPFLSAYSLDSYHGMEEKFTQALVAYTKKQFFQVTYVPISIVLVILLQSTSHVHKYSYYIRMVWCTKNFATCLRAFMNTLFGAYCELFMTLMW